MPHKLIRFNDFLEPYTFYTNSIEFRIHSSRALEQWKNVQGFQLNQLANGRFYFAQPQREILLLNYDLWSRFLYELENFCIELSGSKEDNTMDNAEVEFIINLAEKVFVKFDEVVALNPEKFDTTFTNVWVEQHLPVRKYIMSHFESFVGSSFIEIFTRTVDLMTCVLQHALIEIHEIDHLKNRLAGTTTDPVFLVINKFNQRLCEEQDICLLPGRIETYKKYFDFNEVVLKNYTSDPIPAKIADAIEEMGIVIDYKLSSRFDNKP